jgi:hypothetical protein
MTARKGFVVPAGGGKHLDMAAPGRFAALKLLGHETNESIMMFEETVPPGTKSLFHLHRDSDEVAWVLAGEITVRIGDDVSVGALRLGSRRPQPALRGAPVGGAFEPVLRIPGDFAKDCEPISLPE